MGNVIGSDDADEYLKCTVDEKASPRRGRVCPGRVDEFAHIVEHCVLPGICAPSFSEETEVPTEDPTVTTEAMLEDVCCAAAGVLQGMTCRCRRSCAGKDCEEGSGFAFDGRPKCTGKGICCCSDVCNKRERPEYDTCDAAW